MALLKEDGSLNIEWINKLTHDEYVNVISHFTKEQRQEYYSRLPQNESNQTIQPVLVDSVDDFLNRGGWVDAVDFINKMSEKYGIK